MKKTVTVVVGGQFGSEAKGKVVSFLSSEYDLGVRTGSPNAGHTVFHNGHEYRLQQVPATFPHNPCQLYIGAGALIDPEILRREIKDTQTQERVFIDSQAGIICPYHQAQERELKKNIGSTGKGCGAALIDRIWRNGFQLAQDELSDLNIVNAAQNINQAIDNGKRVLVEGTQGFGLSLYHGEYPFVTSRDTSAAEFLAEAGVSPLCVEEIILVVRTYPIRVAGNSGSLPYEITWQELSQKHGKDIEEVTTVTGNVRRVARLDPELVKKSIEINRPTQIALQFLNYVFPDDEGKNNWSELTSQAKSYVKKLEELWRVPITLIGTHRDNSGMIDRRQDYGIISYSPTQNERNK